MISSCGAANFTQGHLVFSGHLAPKFGILGSDFPPKLPGYSNWFHTDMFDELNENTCTLRLVAEGLPLPVLPAAQPELTLEGSTP